MQSQSIELVRSIRSARRKLESLEKEAISLFGYGAPVVEDIGFACTYLMNADIEMEDVPRGEISQNMLEENTLDQILDALKLIRDEEPGSRTGLVEACPRVFQVTADFYRVEPETIRCACTRRLQLNIREFRELVENWLNGDASGLKSILKSHTMEHYHSEIDLFLPKFQL